MTYNEEAPLPGERETGLGKSLGNGDGDTLLAILPDAKPPKATRFAFASVLHGQQEVALGGRNRWMLRRLIGCGGRGLTAAECPAGVRVSALIHNLRREGIPIVSETERHTGDFPGNHCRYVLDTRVHELP
jgi:hypothetical protein